MLAFYSAIEGFCYFSGFISNAKSDIIEKVDCESLIPADRPDLKRFCVGVHPEQPNKRQVSQLLHNYNIGIVRDVVYFIISHGLGTQ